MNQNIKIIFIIVVISLFTGCFRDNNEELDRVVDSIIGSALTYDTRIPVNNGEDISIIFWTQVDYEDLYTNLINDYMEVHPNVSVELIPASFKDHFSKLETAMTAGIGPDLFHMHNSYTNILLKHMEPYPNDILSYEALITEFSQTSQHIINGSIYFIDTGFMTSSIFYNKDIWSEAGLTDHDFPNTWEEFKKIADKLTKRDNNGHIMQSGFNPNGQGFELFSAMNLQKGQHMFSPENKKSPILDTEQSRDSLNFIKSFYSDDGVIDINFPLFHVSFGAGSSAMIYSWGWTINWIKKNFPNTNFGTFPTPVWSSYPNPGVVDRNNRESSMAVSRYSSDKRKSVAFDLLKFFLANDTYLMDINIQLGTIPSKKSLEKNIIDSDREIYSSFISIINNTVWPGVYPLEYESDIIHILIDPVIIDKKPVDRTLKELIETLEPKMLQSNFSTME